MIFQMKRILNQLTALVAAILFVPAFGTLTAQNTASKTGTYLQEVKKEITIPGENQPEIIRLLKLENNIVAVSKDKIFRYNGKNWTQKNLIFSATRQPPIQKEISG
jgi:hypothetical protein